MPLFLILFVAVARTLVAAKLLERDFIGIDISSEAVKLSNARLLSPIKTESKLLKNGIELYKNQDSDIINQLSGLDIVPVQRNNGIDALLKLEYRNAPVPIKVQGLDETLSEAASTLYKTSKKKNAAIMILVKTHEEKDLGLSVDFPSEIVVIDLTVVSIKNLLKKLNDEK